MLQQPISLEAMKEYAAELFDRDEDKAAPILKAILDSRSPRLTDISQVMPGSPGANYKAIQRFLDKAEPQKALTRLYIEEEPFILVDPTEMPRPQAKKTAYVGKLKDGKTRGFWLLLLGVPYRGRVLPFHFITYSSSTINAEATSRNLEHRRALGTVQELIGDKPLVMDREFSYEGFLADLIAEELRFVIRLNVGSGVHLVDEFGERVSLSLSPGEQRFFKRVKYKGKVEVNLAGYWRPGLKEPLWVISNLEPEEALEVYKLRMKVEESFKDLKSLLCLDKMMNKKRELMEKMVAMVLLAYGLGLLVGEKLRDRMYRGGKKMGNVFRTVHPTKAAGAAG
jgi:hypothetical protein